MAAIGYLEIVVVEKKEYEALVADRDRLAAESEKQLDQIGKLEEECDKLARSIGELELDNAELKPALEESKFLHKNQMDNAWTFKQQAEKTESELASLRTRYNEQSKSSVQMACEISTLQAELSELKTAKADARAGKEGGK